MSNTPRPLTRAQLRQFAPDPRALRALEQAIQQGSLLPSDIATLVRLIEESYVEASFGTSRAQSALDQLVGIHKDLLANLGAADSKATAALDALNSIAKSLDLLARSPAVRQDNSLSSDYIDFNANPKFSARPGRVHWGSTGTLEIEMGGGNITQQVGEEFFTYGKATAAITEGQLIMVTGAVGASGVVTFAPTTTGLLDPNAILGVATENIALNAFGRVTMMGVVHGINTTGSSVGEVWADGDVLWYNTAFVGGMTKVKPVAPNMKTQVAIVINASSGGSGSLQVEVINGSTLGGTDANVQLGALADKQLLQYDSVAGYWKNVAASAVGSTAAETHAAASKTTPVDADEIPLADSAASFALKKLTWANLKATLATWLQGGLISSWFTTVKATTTMSVGGATPSASGAGVSFPATQSSSTDVNTLDDYEEQTWTPTVTASSGAITTYTASGVYTKVGRVVHASAQITLTNIGTASGALIVTLPFSASTFPNIGAGREDQNTGTMLQARIGSATPGSALVLTYNNLTAIANGNVVQFSITYNTAT
jgi:hypothetical protein